MGFNEFMTKLFGNKSQRDLKEITPCVPVFHLPFHAVRAEA